MAERIQAIRPEDAGYQDIGSLARDPMIGSRSVTSRGRAFAIAGLHLRAAALEEAGRLIARASEVHDDAIIVRTEMLLRVARRAGQPPERLCGEPCPSVRRGDGTKIPLAAWLVRVAGARKLILSESMAIPGSQTPLNREIRAARADVARIAQDLIARSDLTA